MKKLLSIAVAAMAAVALADDPVVTGTPSTEIGVTKITTTKQNTIVAVPFSSLRANGPVSAKDLVKITNLADGTQLFVFDGSAYSAWVLDEGVWEAATSATLGGIVVGTPAEDQTLATGSAIWLVRPESDTGSKDFYVYGKFEANVSQSIVVGTNLIANPLQGKATFNFEAATAGDVITVPNDNVAPVRYTYDGTNWKRPGASRFAAPVVEKPDLEAGCGFWYTAKKVGTMTWTPVSM